MDIDKGPFVVFETKTAATNLQRFAMQWLIAIYGLSYAKSIQISVLKEMLIAIIDEHNLLGEGQSCALLHWGASQCKLWSIFTQVYTQVCSK